MGALVRHAVFATTRRMGLWRAVHHALCRGQVTIVTYHGIIRKPLELPDRCFIEESAFAEQIEYLQRHFDVIPLSAATKRLGTATFRRPAAAITFDDGYQNNFDVAWPILRRAGVPATIFLSTNFIDSDDMIWSCRLHRAMTETTCSELAWNGERLALRTAMSRRRALSMLKQQFKQYPQAQLAAELTSILHALGDTPDRPAEADSPFRMLSTAAIREMSQSGSIAFGAHTCSHAIVSRLSAEECEREIRDSIAAVASVTERPCTLFAYPNGHAEDYNLTAIKVLAENGVQTAVTMVRQFNNARTPSLELGRVAIRGGMTLVDFATTVHHTFLTETAVRHAN